MFHAIMAFKRGVIVNRAFDGIPKNVSFVEGPDIPRKHAKHLVEEEQDNSHQLKQSNIEDVMKWVITHFNANIIRI